MRRRGLHERGEEGATLILVIGFMVFVGLISAALATQLASSSITRIALDRARNRQYAADGAIEWDIGQVRSYMTNTSATAPCPGANSTRVPPTVLNGVPIQVDCSYNQTFTLSLFVQRDATFTACLPQPGNAKCPASAVIIKAQVNFASQNAPGDTTITVDKTYIQTWSVAS
jgi:hypothetical protein